jgi:hypothetical protein
MQSAWYGQGSCQTKLLGTEAGFSIAACWRTPELKPLETKQVPQEMAGQNCLESLDSQALAAFGTARIDHSATATGLHADQKAVGTGAANFGRLVCAFHLESLLNLLL